MDAIDKQKLEVLDGSRSPAGKSRAAVRRGDLVGIQKIGPMTSARLSTSATLADCITEYNLLRNDVIAIWNALNQVAAQVKS